MTGWRLRLARHDDAEFFHRIEADAAGALAEVPALDGVPLPPPVAAEDYAKLIAKRHCLTVMAKDVPVGFVATRPAGRALHIAEISVLRRWQKQGIGAGLLRALAADARNSGFDALTLDTFRDVPFNAPLYARLGFVEVENFESWPHLRQSLETAETLGIAPGLRVAMVRFLA